MAHIITLLLGLITYQSTWSSPSEALQIRASASPRANNINCNEVLTKNLECPSVGSFPVAGQCDYFARCIQTENGVESEVDFCPDGHIYVVNRCVRSQKYDCPQKICPVLHAKVTTTAAPKMQTTPKTIFPTSDAGQITNTETKKPKQIHTTKRPLLNLHPLSNEATLNNEIRFNSILLLSTLVIINNLF